MKKIFLVGSPNVGKSVLFNTLTGSYVTVSNYPGTTVDIASGTLKIGDHHEFQVIDTPGMYSLRPITPEENVSRKLLFDEKPDCLLHIVDAKNLERMLPMTMQLIEARMPVILVLNLYDEFLARGMRLSIAHLEHDLGIPVVETVAVSRIGVENLVSRIVSVIESRHVYNSVEIKYSPKTEGRISAICDHLKRDYPVSKRSIATFIIQDDQDILTTVKQEDHYQKIKELIGGEEPQQRILKLSQERQTKAREIVQEHVKWEEKERKGEWKEKLSRLMVHPVWGVPILLAVLWFGLYKFVGEFGAGTMVDYIETDIFEAHINPRVESFFHFLFGDNTFFDLFAGEFGILTLGFRYAFAIIFPIVATFFIVFSIIEDTGYLPRLAMLVDGIFKKIGLSGRAVIPITLGFGCDTMATVVTRTLETTKERILATILLALVIPCSAQLGVLLGLLAGNPLMLSIWLFTVVLVFLFVGYVGRIILKGDEMVFFMELPPLRAPNLMNVFTKTYTRMVWYFKEVLPVFLLASVLIWGGKLTGVFDLLVGMISYPVMWAGMPEGASNAFLYGFFRRDFGAAGLFDLAKDGILVGNALLIAAVVLTLFVPCVAQFAVTWKERGKGFAIGMAAFIFPFAFIVGFLVNIILNIFDIQL